MKVRFSNYSTNTNHQPYLPHPLLHTGMHKVYNLGTLTYLLVHSELYVNSSSMKHSEPNLAGVLCWSSQLLAYNSL